MIKLYTAVGTNEVRSIRGKKRRVMCSAGNYYFPSAFESLLWYNALFGIYTYRELKENYEASVARYHLDSDISFDWYLNHLEELGFIASGQDDTMEDALYDLLKDLYIEVPRSAPLPLRVVLFLEMVFSGHPVKQASQLVRRPKLEKDMEKVVKAASRNAVTTAELVSWAEKDSDLSGDFHELVYTGEITQQDVFRQGRFAPGRNGIVSSVTRLYLDREIMFERLGGAR